MAYLNDENNTFYHCVVIHVGDGFVIAEPNDKGMFGDFCGYIETDDEYVEGQQLKTGFYEFVGRKKVPLVNGSSRSMHAFVRLDTKSNQLAVDAAIYNSKAIEATEQENGRRSVLKREQEEKMRAEAIGKAFAKESKRFKVLDVKDQIHLPPELKGKENCFKISESKVYWGGQRWMSFENIAALINEGDWKKLDNHSGLMTEDCSPEDYAKRLVDHILQGCRYAEVKDRELGVNHFDYIFVSVFPGYHEAERANIQNGLYGGANGAVVPICLGGELYLIPTSDNELVEMLGDAKKFTDAFTKKYGK